jgi:hypothetical protein
MNMLSFMILRFRMGLTSRAAAAGSASCHHTRSAQWDLTRFVGQLGDKKRVQFRQILADRNLPASSAGLVYPCRSGLY